MKTTYLVFENGRAGGNLRVATQEEWSRILKEKKMQPKELKRYFIEDRISEDEDTMFIEVSKEKYDEWHAKRESERRKEIVERNAVVLSLDCLSAGEDNEYILESVSDGIDWENLVTDKVFLEEIRFKLDSWNSWGREMFEYLIEYELRNGENMLSPSKYFTQKYSIKRVAFKYRKDLLADFIKYEMKIL